METSVIRTIRLTKAIWGISRLSGSALALMSCAVLAQNAPTTPNVKMVDENFVQMPSDFITADVEQFAVGGDKGKLSQSIANWSGDGTAGISTIASGFYPGHPFETHYAGGIEVSSTSYPSCSLVFRFLDISERFTCSTSNPLVPLQSLDSKGGSFTSVTDSTWIYTDRYGARYTIDKTLQVGGWKIWWPVTEVDYPDGRILKISYKNPTGSYASYNSLRIQGVENNLGYFIKYEYRADTPTQNNSSDWGWISKASGGNHTNDVCDITGDHCTISSAKVASVNWAADFSSIDIFNAAGEKYDYVLDSYYEITAFTPPNRSTPLVTYSMCARTGTSGNCSWPMTDSSTNVWHFTWSQGGTYYYPGKVYTATSHGETTNYGPSISCNCGGYLASTLFSNDYRGSRTLSIFAGQGNPTDYRAGSLNGYNDEKGQHYYYSGQADNHLTSITDAAGVQTSFLYDSRSNITQKTVTPNDGSAAAVTTAAYPATCDNIVTCNRPTSVTDPNGNRTDYTYDPTHGGLLTETGPPDGNGIRPQKRYSYVQRYAVYYNTAGAITQAPSPVWLLAGESECRTSAWTGTACQAGSADEVRTSYDYGPTTGANNLLLHGKAVIADGNTHWTCYSYNIFGDRVSETSPNANLTSCP